MEEPRESVPKIHAPEAIPVWKHTGVAPLAKLVNYAMRLTSPFPRMCQLKYPEDAKEVEHCRWIWNTQMLALHTIARRLFGWSMQHLEFQQPGGGQSGGIYVHRPPGHEGERLPLLFWIHSGGFTVGSAQDPEAVWLAAALARRRSPVVLACPAYRLAPEHPFPAALEDCCSALTHLLESPGVAEEFGFEAGPVHLAGASAGANLAAAVALRALDAGQRVGSLFLDCPFLDPGCDRPSYAANARLQPSTQWLRWCWAMYLRGDPGSRGDGLACPLLQGPELARLAARLPPVLCVTAMGDPLHDEGIAFVDILREAGAEVAHVESRSSHVLWCATDPAAFERVLGRWARLLGAAPASRL